MQDEDDPGRQDKIGRHDRGKSCMGRSEGKALPWGAWNSDFLLKVGLNCGLYFGLPIFSILRLD
ncbi:MAG: hypothetical protein DSO08_03920 [Candidatus Methanomethylicota archaeon]|uniref:Uncharacterized protein n=1 Tax=Thermoproteota archaeon TaxID=2056631 RepID=A0A523BCB4_9CREN|nr:MAG: hypothetical protein DSO08_03920 [Candidatus Verstraetearchaeota archaeon]